MSKPFSERIALNKRPAARGKPGAVQGLVTELRTIIAQARQQALRAVDVIQVRTCWLVGRQLIEFEQGGASRAAYGRGLLAAVSAQLMAEFGKGFDASNLRYMRFFYQAFPNCDALRHELSWTHYRFLLRVDDAAARTWYMNEAAEQNWNTRALERQIGTLYYERLLASQERLMVREEAADQLAATRPKANCWNSPTRNGTRGWTRPCSTSCAWRAWSRP